MKGILIKRGEGDYKLFVNDTPYAQSKPSPYKRLAVRNCEAVLLSQSRQCDVIVLAESDPTGCLILKRI